VVVINILYCKSCSYCMQWRYW